MKRSSAQTTHEAVLILGGGMTGLSAGLVSGAPVLEARPVGGGICTSYYVKPGTDEVLYRPPDDEEAYRFEVGGGHWVFGGAAEVLHFLERVTPMKRYTRRSGVYFPDSGRIVPYPLQNHLDALGDEVALRALLEINALPRTVPRTMADWLQSSFGASLSDLFFTPFHRAYTGGLWERIAPQDSYKSPLDKEQVMKGAFGVRENVGYNQQFLYPQHGLDALVREMASRCDVRYDHRVVEIDLASKVVRLEDGRRIEYGTLISTLPLNVMAQLCDLDAQHTPDPHTSVLVVNIGGARGVTCPNEHWLYMPETEAGFHRVGVYSNVDEHFLPRSRRGQDVSFYVEKAYAGGEGGEADVASYVAQVVETLQAWSWLGEVHVAHPTWVDVAYTWRWPDSSWVTATLAQIEAHDVLMSGRYARWHFQGIADSIRDGFVAGASAKVGLR